MAKKKPNDYGTGIPFHEVEALARVLLPEIQKFFESAEGVQGVEGKTAEIMMKEMRGIQPRCLSSLCFCLKDILNTNDKSEPVPHLEDSVRIIMSCLASTKKMQACNCCATTLSENFTTSEMAKALGTVWKKLSPNTSVNSTSIYLKLSINASILKELVDDALYSGSSKKESNNAFFIFSSSSESESNGTSFKINTFLYNAAKIIAIEVWNL